MELCHVCRMTPKYVIQKYEEKKGKRVFCLSSPLHITKLPVLLFKNLCQEILVLLLIF